MLRVLTVLAVIVLALLAAAYLYFSNKALTLHITEAQILASQQKRMPVERSYMSIIHLRLQNPRIDLNPAQERIHAGLDFTLELRARDDSRTVEGSVDLSGKPDYVSQEGALFIRDIQVEDIQLPGDVQEKAASTQAAAAITTILKEYFNTHPVYELENAGFKQRVARLLLKDIDIEEDQLVIQLGL